MPNDVGRDQAAAARSNARWAAAEDARDRALAAEEERFYRTVERCGQCARTWHESGVCEHHRREYGIPD